MLPKAFIYEINGYCYYNDGNHKMYHKPSKQDFVLKYSFSSEKIPTEKEFKEVVALWTTQTACN